APPVAMPHRPAVQRVRATPGRAARRPADPAAAPPHRRTAAPPHRRTSEPALDPVCAAYTQAACPMVDLREFAISEARFGVNSSDAGIAKQSNDAWVQEPAPFAWPSPPLAIDDDSGNAGVMCARQRSRW